MDPGAFLEIPPASLETRRSLYFYRGSEINIAGIDIEPYNEVELMADQPVKLTNGSEKGYLLMLQGRPINEPVVQHGPFVMNDEAEIRQAFYDYRKTQFGGWPWNRRDNVHPRSTGRFAKYEDGSEEHR
jgi:redox-sensitive bicupin YhaK (pirin superfamily)